LVSALLEQAISDINRLRLFMKADILSAANSR